jgi:hypothetical protein
MKATCLDERSERLMAEKTVIQWGYKKAHDLVEMKMMECLKVP